MSAQAPLVIELLRSIHAGDGSGEDCELKVRAAIAGMRHSEVENLLIETYGAALGLAGALAPVAGVDLGSLLAVLEAPPT